MTLEQDDSGTISTERKSSARQQPRQLDANKMIDLLDLLVLSRLWSKPMGGYELKKEMMKEFGMRLSFGTIYPHLKNLENSRLIRIDQEAPVRKKKNVYRLTAEGTSALKFSTIAIIKIANNLRPILDS
ncbi:MAG: PadR family transcriptional regulator [Nitrososphaerales archaeon]